MKAFYYRFQVKKSQEEKEKLIISKRNQEK